MGNISPTRGAFPAAVRRTRRRTGASSSPPPSKAPRVGAGASGLPRRRGMSAVGTAASRGRCAELTPQAQPPAAVYGCRGKRQGRRAGARHNFREVLVRRRTSRPLCMTRPSTQLANAPSKRRAPQPPRRARGAVRRQRLRVTRASRDDAMRCQTCEGSLSRAPAPPRRIKKGGPRPGGAARAPPRAAADRVLAAPPPRAKECRAPASSAGARVGEIGRGGRAGRDESGAPTRRVQEGG
jgi:hypothetical protein